jgi:hypothetical protein
VIKIGDGATPFAYLPTYGGSSANSPGGEEYEIQFNYQNGFSADAQLKWDNTSKALLVASVGARVHEAGTLSSPWVPPLGMFASIIRGTASSDLTVKVPSGIVLTAGYEFYWKLVVSNSGTNVIRVNFDQSSGQYKCLWRPPLPDILPSRTVEFWITTNDGGINWFVVGSPYQTYDVKFFVPGIPDAGGVLWEEFVHTGLRLPLNINDVGTSYCLNAPTTQTIFSIQRRSAGQSTYSDVGTLTFAGSQTWSTWNFPGGTVDFAHGDRLRITAPSALNGLAGLVWIMRCAL